MVREPVIRVLVEPIQNVGEKFWRSKRSAHFFIVHEALKDCRGKTGVQLTTKDGRRGIEATSDLSLG